MVNITSIPPAGIKKTAADDCETTGAFEDYSSKWGQQQRLHRHDLPTYPSGKNGSITFTVPNASASNYVRTTIGGKTVPKQYVTVVSD